MHLLVDLRRVDDVVIANLKAARESAGWSQIDLASQTGLSQGFIADIERGRKFPSPESIGKMCRALRLRPYQMFLGPGDVAAVPGAVELFDMAKSLKESLDQDLGKIIERLETDSE